MALSGRERPAEAPRRPAPWIEALRTREHLRQIRIAAWRASRLSRDPKSPGWDRIEQARSTTALAFAQRDPRYAGQSLGPMEKHGDIEEHNRRLFNQARQIEIIRQRKNAAAGIVTDGPTG